LTEGRTARNTHPSSYHPKKNSAQLFVCWHKGCLHPRCIEPSRSGIKDPEQKHNLYLLYTACYGPWNLAWKRWYLAWLAGYVSMVSWEKGSIFSWNLLHNCIVDDVASFWNRCIWYKWRIWCMRMQWMTMVLNLMMTQFLPDVREWFSNNGHLCVTFDFMSAPVQKGVWKYTICCDLELIGCHDGIDNSGFSLLCVVTCMDVACYVGFKIFLHGELGWWIFGRSCMSEELWSFLWRSQTCFWDWFFSEFFLELEAELFVHVHVAFSRPSSAEFLRLKPEVITLYLVGCVVDKIHFRVDECWGFVL